MNNDYSSPDQSFGREPHSANDLGKGGSSGLPPAPPQPSHEYMTYQQAETEQPPQKSRPGIGWAGVVVAVAAAGLIGGGVGATSVALLGPSSSNNQEQTRDISDLGENQGSINRPDDASVITQAAAQASPSVVTIAAETPDESGSGSGVVLDEEGHILTNAHVATLGGATDKAKLQVQVHSGEIHEAKLVGTDPVSDLAVLKIDAANLTPIEKGNSSQLNVGDQVVAIGAPMGLSGTVTSGIVSQLDRTISVQSSEVPDSNAAEDDQDNSPFEFRLPGQQKEFGRGAGQIHLNVIQSDASINPGNSGGALVDDEGKLIGINVAIYSRGEAGSIGLGFAIPADYAWRIAEDLIQHGSAEHAMLGVQVSPDTTSTASKSESSPGFGTKVPEQMHAPALVMGSKVEDVVAGSPAEKAGIKAGDVITHVNKRRIESPTALTATIREFTGDEDITVTLKRGGKVQDVDVRLAADQALEEN